ncbi:MAG: ABC transporter transmembrane domain-containing protein, partial [Coprobacillaceae bacterium]
MFSIFKKNKGLFWVLVIINIISAAVSVGSAFVLQNILDAVTQMNWELFHTMIFIVIAYLALVAILVVFDIFCKKKLIMRTLYQLRQEIYEGVISRDTENYNAINSAEYLSAVTNDIKIIEENMLVPTLQALEYGLIFIMSFVALFYYSPLIAGVMFISLLIMYLLPASLGKPIAYKQEIFSKSLTMFTVNLKDQLLGYDVIRSFQLTNRVNEDFKSQNKDVSTKKYAVDRLIAISQGIGQFLGMGTQLLAMLVSGYLVLKGNMTAGALLGVLGLSGSFVQPVAVIMQSLPTIEGAKPVLQRLQEFSKKPTSSFQGTNEPEFNEEISCKNVSFGYISEQNIIHNLNMKIKKNKKYAIIGASGSGKSTLIK